jgi:hypothetical protein
MKKTYLAIIIIILIGVLILSSIFIENKNDNLEEYIINKNLENKYHKLQYDSYRKELANQDESPGKAIESSEFMCINGVYSEGLLYEYKAPKEGYIGGDWRKVWVVDCKNNYFIYEISDAGSKFYGPFPFIVID